MKKYKKIFRSQGWKFQFWDHICFGDRKKLTQKHSIHDSGFEQISSTGRCPWFSFRLKATRRSGSQDRVHTWSQLPTRRGWTLWWSTSPWMNSLIATRAGLLNSKCFPGFSLLVKDQWNFCENRCVRFSKLPLFNFTVPRASSGICSAFSPTSCGGACKIVLTIVDLTSNSTRKSHHFHLAPSMGTFGRLTEYQLVLAGVFVEYLPFSRFKK